jgi:hypothetical protein
MQRTVSVKNLFRIREKQHGLAAGFSVMYPAVICGIMAAYRVLLMKKSGFPSPCRTSPGFAK